MRQIQRGAVAQSAMVARAFLHSSLPFAYTMRRSRSMSRPMMCLCSTGMGRDGVPSRRRA